MLGLLSIDNKLVAIQMNPLDTFNITDYLVNHTIRKIIFNYERFVILTSTSLFVLHHLDEPSNFYIIDITSQVTSGINLGINNIKFISNLYDYDNRIMILTDTNMMFLYKIKNHKVKWYKSISDFSVDDIVQISSNEAGFVVKDNGDYSIFTYQHSLLHRYRHISKTTHKT